MAKIHVLYKNNNYEVECDLDKQVRAFRLEVQKATGLLACQQGLSYGKDENKVHLEVDKTLRESGVTEETVIDLKDFGKQLPFRFVYICEYVGPLAIYVLCYFISIALGFPNLVQNKIAFYMWTIHYVKRILETIFVHEFGDMTMPFFNLIKNCTYYYGFALVVGINVNFFPKEQYCIPMYLGLLGMIASMVSNGYCHIILKNLRTPGSQEWKMPKGFLFDYITCANYFCEIMTWIFFDLMTGIPLMGVAFSFCGIYQMKEWSLQRHQKYQKLFKDYPNRWILIPYLY
ncbi:synaptic glycoprotein SC2, putative [Entamoeba invadens IP1]|uniref:Synaptic glycoprotein SC2, putative n=2 Tax=Entamoeba invadens TaxID=33085 RepID=A0A0A1U454_ENTIV|nr:synaptic glycoprotein SC2, putative [Entamoeba invadens IP1]ELP87488.1 synaptic glycoprotein SC2, putative [Entamoeba invadens IP1]BAN40457.1 synaptic glycoprotein SC2, putative [Entamoeba invadens]|eukprot:XP_004254259.1 synaptic glycoprotein SC2, putative [Entamoeba invadens IP1]